MRQILPKSLLQLAEICPTPLYVVGGFTRDFLYNVQSKTPDIDICAPCLVEEFASLAEKMHFTVHSLYKNTGTLKLTDADGNGFEFSAFRSDKYIRGVHAPVEVCFTTDISLDAKRRDFTCNAVYYDIKKGEFVDPLGGITDIRNKRMITVADAKKVFGEDGLRLMRLARQCAELGFSPDEACLQGAKANARLILDIVPERIYAELDAILHADKKYGVKGGHYHGVCLLNEMGVLDYVLPELTAGRGMAQRSDFHNYDVLQHSLRAVLYAQEDIRLSALLHDVGKPYCVAKVGHSHEHAAEGAPIAESILTRLKVPKRLAYEVQTLVRLHMYDFNCQTSENKLRRFFVTHHALLPKLLALKQADFSACKDNLNEAPTKTRWQAVLQKMQEEGTPFSLKELAVSGNDLLAQRIPAPFIGDILQQLLLHTAVFSTDNTKEKLLSLSLSIYKQLQNKTTE